MEVILTPVLGFMYGQHPSSIQQVSHPSTRSDCIQ